jgi:hypothetical protein
MALFVTAAFAASALASPVVYDSCNSGPVQCCETLPWIHWSVLAGLVGVVIGAITVQVGVECNLISVLGLGSGASWYVFSFFLSSCNHMHS